MGAWGLGLFESDHDFDLLREFNQVTGLYALRDQAKKRAEQSEAEGNSTKKSIKITKGKREKKDPLGRADSGDAQVNLSLFADQCSDIELVREYLDAGELSSFADYLEKNITTLPDDEKPYATYDFVLFGACAISLGCKLPARFKTLLIEKYRTSGLKRDSVLQMQLALSDGHRRCKEGEPYEFDSSFGKGEADRIYPNSMLINVPAPFGFHAGGEGTEARTEEYPDGVCGGCGSKERSDGETLLVCGKCKVKKYCGRVCQTAHFKQHKPVCKG